MQEHTLVCQGFMVCCPVAGCRAMTKRSDMERHMNRSHRVSRPPNHELFATRPAAG